MERTIFHKHEGTILPHNWFFTELVLGVISCFRKSSDTETYVMENLLLL